MHVCMYVCLFVCASVVGVLELFRRMSEADVQKCVKLLVEAHEKGSECSSISSDFGC